MHRFFLCTNASVYCYISKNVLRFVKKKLVFASFVCWIDSIVNAAVVKFNAPAVPGNTLFDGREQLSCDVVRMKV